MKYDPKILTGSEKFRGNREKNYGRKELNVIISFYVRWDFYDCLSNNDDAIESTPHAKRRFKSI